MREPVQFSPFLNGKSDLDLTLPKPTRVPWPLSVYGVIFYWDLSNCSRQDLKYELWLRHSSSMFTCAHGSTIDCVVTKWELQRVSARFYCVATNILPLISPTTTTPLNQNNKMEGHIFASHRNKKNIFLCQMDPFLKWLPYVHLCCRCRIMHIQDTEYFYVLALSMMYSCITPLCDIHTIRTDKYLSVIKVF